MKFAKSYIDNYFDTINDYNSKSELFCLAYFEFKERNILPEWYVELREVMNWQSQSESSGVWTYYEILEDASAKILVDRLKTNEEKEFLDKYVMGINQYTDETIMDEIDEWICKNEDKIYQYINDILISNKDWFYNI